MPRKFVLVVVVLLLAAFATGCSESANGPGNAPGNGLHSIVPSVVDLPLGEAALELEEAGFTVGDIIPDGAQGTVVEQDPPAGYSAPKGDPVDLTVTEE
jgi:hypothetical protein